MEYGSLFQQFELFVASATIAAHASCDAGGFRQRDVKFLIELFSNWVESGLGGFALPAKNTQVLRYMSALVSEGYARKVSKRGQPCYRLTRTGLLELLMRIVNRNYTGQREHFFFLFYFIRNYKGRILGLVRAEGKQFPPALQLELDALLDESELVRREIKEAERELARIGRRISDAESTSKLMTEGRRKGEALESMVKQVERFYPYELNSQKPLHELISGIPADHRHWELESGNLRRVADIWKPSQRMLQGYYECLQQLAKAARVSGVG